MKFLLTILLLTAVSCFGQQTVTGTRLQIGAGASTIAGSLAVTGNVTGAKYNGLTVSSTTGTLTITNGKVLSSTNTLTFAGTDGSTLNIGTGGTLGTGAFATIANYLPLAGGTMTGNLLFTDNTLDIGASGATRPRTLYLGTSIVVPTVTATTLTGAAGGVTFDASGFNGNLATSVNTLQELGDAVDDLATGGSLTATLVGYGSAGNALTGEAAFNYVAGTNTLNVDNLVVNVSFVGPSPLLLDGGAAPTVDAFGELAGDNNAWAASRGALKFYDGTASTVLLGVLTSDTPSNGQVPVWNTGGTITWEANGAGGSFDATAQDALTWSDGANASNLWTMDVSGTDTTVLWGSAMATFSHGVTAANLTDSGLTSGRVTFASTAGLLADDADMTFATDTLTVTKLIASTSITNSSLTSGRVIFSGASGIQADDADMTFATDTLTITKLIASTALRLPATAGTATLTTAGDINLNTTDKQIGVYNGTKEVAISLVQHFRISFDPKAVCDGAVDRLFLMTVTEPKGITITRWNLSFEADPTTEVDLDFSRADAFIGVANAAVMDVLDTTAGVSSETTAANINSGAVVATGKVIYLSFGTAYTETTHQMIFEFDYEVEED